MASTAAVLNVIVSANTTQATAALARVDKQLKGTAASGAAAQGGVSKFDKAAKMAALGGAAAMGYALYKSVQVGMDFEKQMSSLSSVTRASADDMEKLKTQALEMGQSTVFGARDVVKAQTELAKGGLNVKQILGGALPSALNLAAAGEMDLAEAANTVANAMNLFNMRGRDSGKVADMLATAANSTTADVADFAMALTQGGSAAKQVGYSLNDTVVVLEALAKAGIKNSDAGTSMKTALLQLVAPTARQTEMAKKLGLEFTNQAGEMKNPIQLAGDLQKALGGMTRAQRTAAMKVLAGTDGFRTLASLYDLGAKGAADLAEQNAKMGTAAEVAAEKNDNLAGDIERLKGALETKGIQIYDDIEPQLRSATKAVSGFIEGMPEIDWSQWFGDPITVGSQLGRRLGGAIGQGIRSAGGAALNLAGDAVGQAKTAFSKVQSVVGKGADIALGVAGDAVGQARTVWNRVKSVVGKAIDFAISLPMGAVGVARTLWTKVKSTVSKSISIPVSVGEGAVDAANSLKDTLVGIFSNPITQPVRPSGDGGGSWSGRARGGRNIGPETALVGEQGRELMRSAQGAWTMLGARGPHLASIPAGSDIFTAAETRKLLAAGIPGFKGGKKGGGGGKNDKGGGKRKKAVAPTGNMWEAALAAAELTDDFSDDIAALQNLITYWKGQEAWFSVPRKGGKGTKGTAMAWDKLSEARQAIKTYQDQLAEFTGGPTGDELARMTELADLNKQLATTNAQRFAVSQSQYPVFGGSFHSGGVVPGPVGAERMILAQGGETVSKGAPEVHLHFTPGTEWLRDFVDLRVENGTRGQSRRAGRGLPGRGGGLT